MKQAVAYYFFIFYLVALFKPILPFGTDFLAHCFAQQYHISTVHQRHGSNHVHLEMAAAAGEDVNAQNLPKTKFSEPVSDHLASPTAYQFDFQLIIGQHYYTSVQKTPQPLLNVVIPPPKHIPVYLVLS